ncbi:unnamed protein product [Mucor circinelloides]
MGKHKKKKKVQKPSSRNDSSVTRTDQLGNDFWLPTIKRRRRFSSSEIKLLQKEYNTNCSPCAEKIEEIADLFRTDKKIITTWFQNKRAKNKKLQAKSPKSVASVDGQEEEEQYDFEDDTATVVSNANTDMDMDTFHVMNGDTALTTPTCILRQQEHQNIISTLSSPQYTHKCLSDYFSTHHLELYYLATQGQEQEEASSFFTNNSSNSSNRSSSSANTTDTTMALLSEPDEALLLYELDSPSDK